MSYALDPVAMAAAFSGAALAILGLALLLVGRKGRGSVAFALFAVLWGAQIIAANVSRMATDEATLSAWVHTYVALQVPIFVPLVYFAVVHVRQNRVGRSPLFPLLLVLPAAAILLLFAAEPRLFVSRVFFDPASGLAQTETGPLHLPLVLGPFLGGFAVALALVFGKYERAKTANQRSRLLFALAALMAFVGYITAKGATVALTLLPGGLPLLLVMAPGLVVTLLIGLLGLWRVRERARHAALLSALAFAVVLFGVLEAFTALRGLRFETVALWRLLLVGLVVYGIVRFHLFDIDLRIKGSLRPGIVVAGLTAVFFLARELLEFVLPGNGFVPSLAGAGAVGLLALPAWRLAERAAQGLLPGVRASNDYIYHRKIEVYRAALEEAEERTAGTEQAFLGELRRRLGISEQEHRLIRHLVSSQGRTGRPQAARPASGSGRFRPIKELGRGSFGRAILAQDEVLNRAVVLKQPLAAWLHDEAARAGFLREARIMARIQHPNVVTVYEVRTEEDPPALVLEYVEGGSLQERLEARGCLTAPEAVRVARDVLAGLERAHQEGIVHRDLKPANVLLGQDGVAKVTDFGVAHAPEAVSMAATIVATEAPRQPGSLAYMSPEQARGESPDARSDLYAVGVLLYESLTGGLPYPLAGLSPAEIRARVQTAPPRLPADGIPPPLARVLRRALAKAPAERFASAREMTDALPAAR